MFEKIKSELHNINLHGRNLGVSDTVSFDLITNHFQCDDETKKVIEFYEKAYFDIYEKLHNGEIEVNSLNVEDGLVNIKPGEVFHVMPSNFENLKNISVAGLVASEWFGLLESEAEAYFCAFVDQLQEEMPRVDYGRLTEEEEIAQAKWIAFQKNHRSAFPYYTDTISLFFDTDNEVLPDTVHFIGDNYRAYEYAGCTSLKANAQEKIFKQVRKI